MPYSALIYAAAEAERSYWSKQVPIDYDRYKDDCILTGSHVPTYTQYVLGCKMDRDIRMAKAREEKAKDEAVDWEVFCNRFYREEVELRSKRSKFNLVASYILLGIIKTVEFIREKRQ